MCEIGVVPSPTLSCERHKDEHDAVLVPSPIVHRVECKVPTARTDSSSSAFVVCRQLSID